MDFPFDAALFYQAFDDGHIVWRKHTLERMLLRGISREEVLKSIKTGEIIQVYDYDRPFPSVLLLGFPDARPVHVVASFDEIQGIIFIITAYELDLNIFEFPAAGIFDLYARV